MAVQNIAPPFRADHVGSLKRPDDLLKKRDEFDAGHATKADLAQVEDQAIKDIVQMQQKVGIKAITDGASHSSEPCLWAARPRLCLSVRRRAIMLTVCNLQANSEDTCSSMVFTVGWTSQKTVTKHLLHDRVQSIWTE